MIIGHLATAGPLLQGEFYDPQGYDEAVANFSIKARFGDSAPPRSQASPLKIYRRRNREIGHADPINEHHGGAATVRRRLRCDAPPSFATDAAGLHQ
jgi:hypothetical protein